MWFGTTVTNDEDMQSKGYDLFEVTGDCQEKRAKRFLSIEPLLGGINKVTLENVQHMDWIIIGQQTGPGAVSPKNEWVQSIIDQCRAARVPVFVKSPLYSKLPIQEWPEGLK
jgi:protein gp37